MTDLASRPEAPQGAGEPVERKTDPADLAIPAPRAKATDTDTLASEPEVTGHMMGTDTLAPDDAETASTDTHVESKTLKTDDESDADKSDDLEVPDSLAPYVRKEEDSHNKNRSGLLRTVGVGLAGAAITAAAFLGLSNKGSGEQTTKPEPTELPGKPAPSPEGNAPSGELPELSADPFVTPSGEAIQYGNRFELEDLGDLMASLTPEENAESVKNEDLVNWFYDEVEPSIKRAVQQGGKALVMPGCSVRTQTYTASKTGEKIETTKIIPMPFYAERLSGGKLARSYTSTLDSDSTVTVITEGAAGGEPNDFERVAYANKGVEFIPFDPDNIKPVEVEVSPSDDVSKMSNQRGGGGFAVKAPEGSSKFVAGRQAIIVGKLSPEKLAEACQQFIVNTGYKA